MKNERGKKVIELVNNIDEPVRKYVAYLGDSNISWELIKFYHYNPYTLFTVERLSVFLGRDKKDLEKSVDELIKKNVLQKISQGKELPEVFTYNPPDISLNHIEKFLEVIRQTNFSPQEIISKFPDK